MENLDQAQLDLEDTKTRGDGRKKNHRLLTWKAVMVVKEN